MKNLADEQKKMQQRIAKRNGQTGLFTRKKLRMKYSELLFQKRGNEWRDIVQECKRFFPEWGDDPKNVKKAKDMTVDEIVLEMEKAERERERRQMEQQERKQGLQ